MKKHLIITVAEPYLNQLDRVAEKLKSEGLVLNDTYAFGVITGEAEEDRMDSLVALDEVFELKEDTPRSFIAPPEAEVQ